MLINISSVGSSDYHYTILDNSYFPLHSNLYCMLTIHRYSPQYNFFLSKGPTGSVNNVRSVIPFQSSTSALLIWDSFQSGDGVYLSINGGNLRKSTTDKFHIMTFQPQVTYIVSFCVKDSSTKACPFTAYVLLSFNENDVEGT